MAFSEMQNRLACAKNAANLKKKRLKNVQKRELLPTKGILDMFFCVARNLAFLQLLAESPWAGPGSAAST